jgi:putative glutamine amidotransferase
VEAIELPDRRFALGVLWHPEEDMKSRVIASLVKEAEAA